MEKEVELIKQDPKSMVGLKTESENEFVSMNIKTERDVDMESQINEMVGVAIKNESDYDMYEANIKVEAIPGVKEEMGLNEEEHLPEIKTEELMLKCESGSETGTDDCQAVNEDTIYACNRCNYTTQTRFDLKTHMVAIHEEDALKKHACPHCSYRIHYKSNHRRNPHREAVARTGRLESFPYKQMCRCNLRGRCGDSSLPCQRLVSFKSLAAIESDTWLLTSKKMRDDLECFNIQFCAEIENCPSLYDFHRSDYCIRSVQDKAWQTIARKFNETVNVCKERWRYIRERYVKYKKKSVQPSGSGVQPIRKYYLAAHLQFLDNFLKSRHSTYNINKKQTVNSKENPNQEKDDDTVSVDEEPDSDMAFLQSLLPDIEAMNDQQKRKFKIGILTLAENILEQSDSVHSSWISGSHSSEVIQEMILP